MESTTESVIESLAEKLAAADLTDAEIDLLRTLLADDDVTGFSTAKWAPLLSAGASTKGWSYGAPNLIGDDIGQPRSVRPKMDDFDPGR